MTKSQSLTISKRRFLRIGGIFIGLVALVLIFLQFLPSPVESTPFVRMPSPQVQVINPAQGEVYTVGDPINVQTIANGQHPFQLTELWINGVLVGTDPVPFEGINPWGSIFSWIPTEVGVYSLMARVVDDQGNQSYSNGVVVYVEEDENKLSEGAAGEPVEKGDSPGPSVYPAAAPVSAQTNPSAAGAPLPPILSIQTDGCDAVLSIQDQSENEVGFAVYRQMLYQNTFIEIASLDPQEGTDLLPAYSDTDLTGGITYYVTAFNGEGEASSNLAIVNFESEDCAPEDQAFDVLSIRYVSFTTDLNVDQAYCYRSYNGLDWTRWPEFGFFPVNGEEIVLPEEPENHMLGELEGEPLFQPFDLRIECWGWEGETLTFLGSVLFENLGPESVGDHKGGLGHISVILLLEITKHFVPTNYTFNDGFQELFFKLTHLKIDINKTNLIPDLIEGIVTIQNMPNIAAWKFFTEEACFLHLEPEAQTAFATLFLCSPTKGYHKGPDGINPQPFILWHIFELVCSREPCLPLSWWQNFAEQRGGRLYMWVYEEFTGYLPLREMIDDPLRTVFRPYWRDCEGDRIFRIQMVVELKSLDWMGPKSNPVIVKCTKEITDQVQLEITVTTLQISHADDGINDNVLEAYGLFGVLRSTVPLGYWRTLTLPRQFGFTGAGYAMKMSNGTYNFSDFELCQQIHEVAGRECDLHPNNSLDWEFVQNNNSMIVPVTGGEALRLEIGLFDDDVTIGNHSDPICVASLWTADKTLNQWAATKNETYQLHQPNNGNAECWVNITISAIND